MTPLRRRMTEDMQMILREVLRQVSPLVIRLVSVADQMPLYEFHDLFIAAGPISGFEGRRCFDGNQGS
jgi:hypothetical protein